MWESREITRYWVWSMRWTSHYFKVWSIQNISRLYKAKHFLDAYLSPIGRLSLIFRNYCIRFYRKRSAMRLNYSGDISDSSKKLRNGSRHFAEQRFCELFYFKNPPKSTFQCFKDYRLWIRVNMHHLTSYLFKYLSNYGEFNNNTSFHGVCNPTGSY